MKTLSYWVLGLGLIVLAFVGLSPEPKPNTSATLPWDIRLVDGGHSEVFGITLGQTTVSEALAILGVDHDLAIISDQQDKSGLEIYYSHFRTGPLAAKLVLSVNIDPLLLETMQARASNAQYLQSGARKFSLNDMDLDNIQNLSIGALSLIPSANLSRETIIARFGEPAEIIVIGEQAQHLLYPAKGLDVAFHPETKETLQYTAPRDFEQLRQPLRKRQLANKQASMAAQKTAQKTAPETTQP